MYSTGNYIEYPMINGKEFVKNHNGKESVTRMHRYMFLTEVLCCVTEIGNNIVNQLLQNRKKSDKTF